MHVITRGLVPVSRNGRIRSTPRTRTDRRCRHTLPTHPNRSVAPQRRDVVQDSVSACAIDQQAIARSWSAARVHWSASPNSGRLWIASPVVMSISSAVAPRTLIPNGRPSELATPTIAPPNARRGAQRSASDADIVTLAAKVSLPTRCINSTPSTEPTRAAPLHASSQLPPRVLHSKHAGVHQIGSTPDTPTGPYSPPSRPAEVRSSILGLMRWSTASCSNKMSE